MNICLFTPGCMIRRWSLEHARVGLLCPPFVLTLYLHLGASAGDTSGQLEKDGNQKRTPDVTITVSSNIVVVVYVECYNHVIETECVELYTKKSLSVT
ncbi:hypothetical protein OUZ56_003177 [Daphnia magna]|uniref:Uncharacterized protein n=1 Tax=Daphnia magna TaxID=35525 RepID=A0ABR0A7Z2_9CRUS|nr:hypothetical protein OUZ56_003177 [Daphnia magna]